MDMTLPRLEFIPFAFPGVPHIRCAFQLRRPVPFQNGPECDTIAILEHSGERVIMNRRAIAPALGIDGWAEMNQVHGAEMEFEPAATAPDCPATREVDGLATTRKQFGLMVKSADCQPLFLADRRGGHLAALHVGWRGNRINFPGEGVRRFCSRYDLDPRDLYAVRGPSLGRGVAEFARPEQEWSQEFMRWYDSDTRTMDLWGMTRDQLQEAGLLPEHIYGIDLCTLSLCDRLFSFRAGHAGRQASIGWIAG